MKKTMINEKRKDPNLQFYGDLTRHLTLGFNEYKKIFPDDDLENFIEFVRDTGTQLDKARAWLYTHYADIHKPAGLNTQAVLKQKMIDLPNIDSVVQHWGEAMVLLSKVFNDVGMGRLVQYFYYPVSKLFDHEKESFILTDEFKAELDKFSSWNVSKPENKVFIDELIEKLNQLSEVHYLGSPDEIHFGKLSSILTKNKDGQYAVNESQENTLVREILGISYSKQKYERLDIFRIDE